MKAVRILLILAMTCVLFCAQGIAISEEGAATPPLRHILDIELTVSPDELVGPGEVVLTFEMRNNSQYSAENLCFAPAGADLCERLGQIPAGGVQVFTHAYEISEDELEAGNAQFVVSHDGIAGDKDTVEYEVSAMVEMVEPKADVEFTRRISSGYVSPGSAVEITYGIKNTGNVPLEDVKVMDKLGDFSAVAEALACGEEKIFTSRIIAEEDMLSRARAEYKAPAADRETHEKALVDEAIYVVLPELTATLEMESNTAEYGETINGVVTIAASGTDFTDVYVLDDVSGAILADSCEISRDGSIDIACSWPVRAPCDYRVMVSGLSATGDRFDAISNTEEVGLTGEFSNNELSISATAATPEICREGRVRITVAIENNGNSAARNVTLRETGMGEIRRFAFIPTGEPTYRQVLVDVEEDTTFEFCVCVDDENGVQQTVQAVAVPVAIVPGGAEPEAVNDAKETGIIEWVQRNITGRETFMRMLAVAAAVLGILVIVLVVSHSREYARRRQRKARIKRRSSTK